VNAALIPVIAALFGVVAGAVLKHYFDLRASRQGKLLDEKLKYAVAFLATTDWAGRSFETSRIADERLGRAITDGTDGDILEAERERDRALEQGEASLKDAHTAACALRLLMPEVGDAASDYINLSVRAIYSSEDQHRRDDARAAVEASLVKAFRTAPRRALRPR
jgi:hypothetical protein